SKISTARRRPWRPARPTKTRWSSTRPTSAAFSGCSRRMTSPGSSPSSSSAVSVTDSNRIETDRGTSRIASANTVPVSRAGDGRGTGDQRGAAVAGRADPVPGVVARDLVVRRRLDRADAQARFPADNGRDGEPTLGREEFKLGPHGGDDVLRHVRRRLKVEK